MSNLVDHADRELHFRGDSKEDKEGLLRVIQAFADMGHSGGSAGVAIPTINRLLQFENLTPLTNHPTEWNRVGNEMWQSSRNPEAFSTDEGETYYLLSEGGCESNPWPKHKTEEAQ